MFVTWRTTRFHIAFPCIDKNLGSSCWQFPGLISQAGRGFSIGMPSLNWIVPSGGIYWSRKKRIACRRDRKLLGTALQAKDYPDKAKQKVRAWIYWIKGGQSFQSIHNLNLLTRIRITANRAEKRCFFCNRAHDVFLTANHPTEKGRFFRKPDR